jgi:plastocyanin domain-containing protein
MKSTNVLNKFDLNRLSKAALVISCTLVVMLLISGAAQAQRGKRTKPRTQSARVEINQMGYQPASLTLRRSIPARITFLRTTDNTCGTEVVFPDYGITRALPLNQPVVITFTPKTAGEFTFTCGMNMLRGKVIVR